VKGEIRHCTLTQTKSGKYYISILSQEKDEIKCSNGEKVGIDMTFHGVAVLSTGEKVNAPSWFYAFEKRYKKTCKLFSRTVKDSKRHEKARRRLARICEKIANARLDFLHKLARRLANTYETAVVEDINMQGLARHAHWGKRVNDLGFGAFRRLLGYKMNHLVIADKFYPSSQLCSACGHQYGGTKDLSVREWDCPRCGAHHDRDINAAINLKNYSTTATVGIDARGLCGREGGDESSHLTGAEDETRKIVGHRKAENLA
jgi:putative transposase